MENGLSVLKRAQANPYRAFNARLGDETSAGARMRANVLCPVHHVPKFKIPKSSGFFTTGSCFAREVEIALGDLGIRLTAEKETFLYEWFNPMHGAVPGRADADLDAAQARPRSPLNRYSPASMLYDIERALEHKHSFDQTVIPLDGAQKVWDPQLKNLIVADRAFAERMRGVLDRAIVSMKDADVVVMTLGMTETWIDNDSGAVLPTPPGPMQVKRFPDRFRYFVADYAHVMQSLAAIIDKVSLHCSRRPNIILTVSPVPMGSTFTDKDVIVANSRSKSTLVAAAQTTAERYATVDYFPSYEIVMHSSRDIWHDDSIHIRAEYVAQIMKKFTDSYLTD